jgi:hypothetical protein
VPVLCTNRYNQRTWQQAITASRCHTVSALCLQVRSFIQMQQESYSELDQARWTTSVSNTICAVAWRVTYEQSLCPSLVCHDSCATPVVSRAIDRHATRMAISRSNSSGGTVELTPSASMCTATSTSSTQAVCSMYRQECCIAWHVNVTLAYLDEQ